MPASLPPSSSDRPYLTPRERLVLERVLLGQSDKEIARALDRSLHTIKNHVRALLAKHGVARRVHLIMSIRAVAEPAAAADAGVRAGREPAADEPILGRRG